MERNYNIYLLGMEKSKSEKLFFMNHLNLSEFDIIIDFGCGAGYVVRTCAENSHDTHCYGIDKDPFMINRAGENCKNLANVILVDDIEQVQIWPEARILLIFSSVLHEVNNYWSVLKNFIKSHSGHITVVVRDMFWWGNDLEGMEANRIELGKIIRNSNPNQLADFVSKYGMKWEKDIYHFLLKYSYIDNWQLELDEDYFSVPWESLEHLATSIIYDRKYVLPFKKDRVREDFGINIIYPTHRQLIIKC